MPANFTGSLAISGSLLITGSIQTTGGITISGSIDSASYALSSSNASNAELLDNLDSTAFVFTSSYNVASSSLSTRVTKIEGNYATTGSNAFNGSQNITGSLTISQAVIAQTLNVQQVTSSIVYSSGSNVFGNQLTDVQQFTGSLRVTGSGNNYFLGGNIGIGTNSPAEKLDVNGDVVIGARSSDTDSKLEFKNGTDVQARIIAQDFSGGGNGRLSFFLNQSGVGLTERLSIERNNGNVGIGTCTPCSILHIQGAAGSTKLTMLPPSGQPNIIEFLTNAGAVDARIKNESTQLQFETGTSGVPRMIFTSTGIACFACQVCAPNVSIVNCLGVGTAAGAGYILDVYQPASSTTAYARIKNNRTRNAALQLETNCGNYLVGVGIGTDTNRLMIYDNNAGATRLTLDQCGNVGLGTTPAAWVSTARAFQINAYNSIASQHNGSFNIISEAYESAANTFAYGSTGGYPTRINMNPNDGVISIFNAPTGTAGCTITWCERMRITSGGNVGIGATSPTYKLQVSTGASGNVANFSDGVAQSLVLSTDANSYFLNASNGGNIIFQQAGSERMRIFSAITLTGSSGGTGGATSIIGSSSMAGLLMVSIATQGVSAIFFINLGNTVNLISQSTTETRFSTTSGAANTANVYISGTDLILQNNIQATRDFYVQYFGKV